MSWMNRPGKPGTGRIMFGDQAAADQFGGESEEAKDAAGLAGKMMGQIKGTALFAGRKIGGVALMEHGEGQRLQFDFDDELSPGIVEIIGDFEIKAVGQ